MYLAHWGLQEPPFRNAVDASCFYQSPTHEEALARLHFLIDGGRRLGLLLGSAGSGKSLLCEVLAVAAKRKNLPVARLSLLGIDKEELLIGLADCWGLNPQPRASAHELWRLLVDGLASQHLQGKPGIVLFDEADEGCSEVLAQVLRLAQTDIAGRPATTLILAARSERVAYLGERLLELADLRIDLVHWNASETQSYIEHCLTRAGRSQPAFETEACALLAEMTLGVPRNVVQLADLALVAAAGQGLPLVDVHTIESVYAELGVVHQVVAGR